MPNLLCCTAAQETQIVLTRPEVFELVGVDVADNSEENESADEVLRFTDMQEIAKIVTESRDKPESKTT